MTRQLLRVALALVVLATTLPGLFTGAAMAQTTSPDLPTDRLSGPNRFATAAAVARATFDTADTVYVAPGGSYAPALAGGPLAALDNAPILLVEADRIPDPTQAELDRLQPNRIVILGSTDDVGPDVEARLAEIAELERIGAADDIGTVAAIAEEFEPGVDSVYLATAADFPDALAGGVAGALLHRPILMVEPDALPQQTAAQLERLAPASIALLGGTAAISDQVLLAVATMTDAPIRRLAGPTRIETALEVSGDTHHDGLSVDTVFLATAANFPDALASAPAIAAGDDALVLTTTECLPVDVRDEIFRLAPDRIVVLGGTAVVGPEAAALQPCDELPPVPTFDVQPAASTSSLPAIGDSGPRPIATFATGSGSTGFVEDEVLVTTDDDAALDAFLADTGGQLLQTIPGIGDLPATHIVRIGQNASYAQAGLSLGQQVQWLDASATGAVTLSSNQALTTVQVATSALTTGLQVGLNFTSESHGLIDRDITESQTTTNNDPFLWNQFRESGTPSIGTAEAWRLLEIGGEGDTLVTIGVVDGGFAATNGDYPPGITGNNGQQNQLGCGSNPCPWHGTDVAVAAAGVIDNDFGSAGAAGPIGRLRLYTHTGGIGSMVNAIQQAVADGVDVINMSFGGEIPATGTIFSQGGEDATEAAVAAGVAVFASAGNDGEDVDAEDCFVFCWEETWHWPCENNGVYCVGGLGDGSANRHSSSNYGSNSVDIFAPYIVNVGERPSNPGDQLRGVSGTSFSSPNVAGIAAQVIAAAGGAFPGIAVYQLLDLTADGSSDSTVGQVVDAFQTVRDVLGDRPAFVEITSPTDGQEFYYGGISTTPLEVLTATVDNAEPQVDWELERLGTNQVTSLNPTQPLSLSAPDTYVVRATATTAGGTSVDEVTVTAVNVAPGATIEQPAVDGQQVVQGQQTTLVGSATDPNEPLGVACQGFQWTLDGQGFAVGCTPTVAFNDLGTHTLALTVTDERGESTTVTRTVEVVAAPETGPPSVNITQPFDGAGLQGGQATQLAGSANDPDGDPITYEWTVSGNFTTQVIGSTPNLTWTPDDDVPFNCGGQPATLTLTATAVDGSSTASVEVYISQPPC